MKINGKPLKETFSYTNVIVEKNEQELKLPVSVPVVLNYDLHNVIGVARPRYLNGAIICNIDIFQDAKGLFPGICHNVYPENNLLYLSVGTEPNIDATIKAL